VAAAESACREQLVTLFEAEGAVAVIESVNDLEKVLER
jgi:hypothetical protein